MLKLFINYQYIAANTKLKKISYGNQKICIASIYIYIYIYIYIIEAKPGLAGSIHIYNIIEAKLGLEWLEISLQ